MAMRRARMPRRPMHPRPPTENGDGWEVSLPASYMIQGLDTEWRVVTLGRGQVFMMVECLWDVKDRESAKPEGTREDGKDISTGESSGKAGGSKRGPQENREGGNDVKTSPRNSAGTTSKKTKVLDTRRKLAEIEKRTAEFKARLIEQMMVGDEENPQGVGSREGQRTTQDEARYEGKDNSHRGTPNKKGKDKDDPPAEGTKNAMTPPAIDSGTDRLLATPKVTGACDGLCSLRERLLGWFDPEGMPKTREKQRESKEGKGTSAAGEAGASEDGLKRVVATLNRTLNKNQGYLADAKKKLTFDGANITEFLIDYENLAALLKWTEEEKKEHLGQHVSLNLGRDIMAIVASSGSWKETRNEMMRKYLKAEKMATKAKLAAVQRKNYATYNDFLRAFTLVALRIPGVTDRIMSKYFLRQFSEFDKDKILSAYHQTSKFEYTRDVDFNTVTDLAEKTVVTESLALLKEGEVIDLTGKTGDKVKKVIESLHERVHGVDSKMDRMENALLVMQAQVSKPALPPQEAVVPAAVANRGFGRRDPANEQCKYCTMIGHFVRACPRLNHDIERQRCSRSLKGEILGPRGERANWNSPGGMRRAVILLNNLEIVAVEAEPIAEIVWDQPRGRGPQANFILEGNGQDRVNITTRRAGAEKKLIQDTVMEELAGTSTGQQETEAAEQEKVYGKPREDEPVDKATAAKKKFRYQIPILTSPEIDGTLSKLLGTMVSVSFQTMLQTSPRLHKGLRQLLTHMISCRSTRGIRPYTAMHTPVGQLQMQVTPMGFTNAVAKAQRRMLAVAGDMFPEKCETYTDDSPVKGARYKYETEVQPGAWKFVWDHSQAIKDLLQRLLVYNITASGPKSILDVPEVTILGFRCGAYGRRPDPPKTDKISQWPTPLRTTTEVRAFLGVVGFWRIFIKGFAKIAEPIRAMIREGGTMAWTEDREEAAQTLKDILSSDQVTLAAPCFNDEVGRPFILETDGGPLAVGGVFIQRSEEGKERPIRFESRTLNSAERRYSQFKKEVLAILHCLKTFQAYLFGRRFIIRIDPTNVVGALKNYKPIDPTVGRWIGFIWQFDYKVERIAGLRNREDGLSRVCIMPEGVEDAEPIDAFLEYEGGTLVVDNEMADPTITTGQLLIQTLEKGTPAVVEELREGPVTTVRCKEEKDSWGA
ncbi:hypothetical protein CBR_g41048 [Chara braunii]|uniref:Reverse transcriptase/retrotransposon-derived protein RNase H-like domain-containing protein n=1 Tax=Chara braunii TaxID=69332 RepID=A0A388LUY6_CHABU|nr:hypothetical protein CBR_g41048 [Chara braunii]|eukprot:GBG86144.1 hypothetical protein CBR_g41048 [Chara braunii]